jgi:hypothetical protein
MNALRYAGLVAGWLTSVTPAIAAQHIDTVRVGAAALRDVQLQPGTYTIESVRRADGRDTPINVTTQTITRERKSDIDVFVVHTTHAATGGDTTIGVIVARASDFALVHHRVKATGDSAAVAATDGYLTGWVVLPGELPRLIDQRLDRPVFAIEGQIPWLFPLLPLVEGYAAAVPHYSEWEGREQWSTIRVVGAERVTRNGQELDCWKVDGGELFPGYGVTYWVDKRTRRVVQGVARGTEAGPEFWSWLRMP